MSTIPPNLLSPEDYLALETANTYKSEFLEGEIWAMTGASEAHVTICLKSCGLVTDCVKGFTLSSLFSRHESQSRLR